MIRDFRHGKPQRVVITLHRGCKQPRTLRAERHRAYDERLFITRAERVGYRRLCSEFVPASLPVDSTLYDILAGLM
jgi:hypothetical protein